MKCESTTYRKRGRRAEAGSRSQFCRESGGREKTHIEAANEGDLGSFLRRPVWVADGDPVSESEEERALRRWDRNVVNGGNGEIFLSHYGRGRKGEYEGGMRERRGVGEDEEEERRKGKQRQRRTCRPAKREDERRTTSQLRRNLDSPRVVTGGQSGSDVLAGEPVRRVGVR
jgi:hypothetical protein